MTRTEAENMVNNHNNTINDFMKNLLPQLLKIAGIEVTEKENGKYEISLNAWFKCQEIIGNMNFYESARKICDDCRSNGYDVKIDMQSNKLAFYGEL